jgi:hypothetical protein
VRVAVEDFDEFGSGVTAEADDTGTEGHLTNYSLL